MAMPPVKRKRPEILAPAGDRERLLAALRYGADAVYLAETRFGMRSAPANFTPEGLREAVRLAHAAGAKAYVACNVLPRNGEIDELPAYLETVQDAGADALIAADLGVLSLARRYAPRCAVHISTQTGVVNYEAARMLYELGASRVVLARELSLAEVAELCARVPAGLEVECFVHGAMCMSVSGRCLLSNVLAGRDANHGDCAQPCRWKYHLIEEKRPGEEYEIGEGEGGSYLLNANDLCMIDHIAALAEAGVASFKIEGRAKAAYYVAAVTNAYRSAVDAYERAGFPADYRPDSWMREELDKVSHRPYGTGFYFGMPKQHIQSGGYIREYEVAAVVEGYAEGRLLLSQRNHFRRGEVLDVLEPGQEPFFLPAEELYDGEGMPIDCAPHPTMKLQIPWPRPLAEGSFLRRKTTKGKALETGRESTGNRQPKAGSTVG